MLVARKKSDFFGKLLFFFAVLRVLHGGRNGINKIYKADGPRWSPDIMLITTDGLAVCFVSPAEFLVAPSLSGRDRTGSARPR